MIFLYYYEYNFAVLPLIFLRVFMDFNEIYTAFIVEI